MPLLDAGVDSADAGVGGGAAGAALPVSGVSGVMGVGGRGKGGGGGGGPIRSERSEREMDASDFWRRRELDLTRGLITVVENAGDCEREGAAEDAWEGAGVWWRRPF
jgi:hypothetical protein